MELATTPAVVHLLSVHTPRIISGLSVNYTNSIGIVGCLVTNILHYFSDFSLSIDLYKINIKPYPQS